MQNVTEYAKSLDIDVNEVMGYLNCRSLRMPAVRLRAVADAPLRGAAGQKYARGITIDMDAMEEQIREAESIDPDSMASAVNITKVAFPDTRSRSRP